MPVQNLFRGVNPHLNSFLQSDGGGWESFHATAIERLTDDLDAHLPAGYYVLCEGVFCDDELTNKAVIIYHFESAEMPGRPVTRLELLSPANKPGGSHHVTYLARRRETLASGLRLVEVDWLHETPPVVRAIPSYPEHASGAYPYWLIISDPRPSVTAGQMAIYGTGVHQPLPTIDLPLEGQDTLAVHFEQIYQRIFESRRLFGMVADYRQPPVRFETYAPSDQAIIQQRMAEINSTEG